MESQTAQQAQVTEAPKTLTVSILKTDTPWAIEEKTLLGNVHRSTA